MTYNENFLSQDAESENERVKIASMSACAGVHSRTIKSKMRFIFRQDRIWHNFACMYDWGEDSRGESSVAGATSTTNHTSEILGKPVEPCENQ